ncbi:MAG: hypothetical protein WD989_02155 [Candidatus Paceibacterota bacterium]
MNEQDPLAFAQLKQLKTKNQELSAKVKGLEKMVDDLREECRRAHADKEDLHDELVMSGIRQETFGV